MIQQQKSTIDLSQSTSSVFVLHGLEGSTFFVGFLARRLRLSGITVNFFRYRAKKEGIQAHVKGFVEFLAAQVTEKKVLIIGHSLGGSIALLAANELAEKGYSFTVIQLGSPNQGSKIARFGWQIVPFVRWRMGPSLLDISNLKEVKLSSSIELHLVIGRAGNKFGWNPFLCGDNDGLVTVREALHSQASSVSYFCCPHWWLPISKDVQKLCLEKIKQFIGCQVESGKSPLN